MIKAIPKLGAIVGATCLVATMALPAYASASTSEPTDAVVASHLTVQTLASSGVATAVIAHDAFSVTEIPKPVVVPQVIVAAASTSEAAVGVSKVVTVAPPAQTYSGAAVLEYASQFVGVVPYGMGNNPNDSFSCDGFVQYVMAGFGYALPRGADHQAAFGTRIAQSDAVAGDLVWWPGQHIGIYDGAGGMYDSPTWGRFVQHPAQLWGSPVFVRLN